MSVQRVESAACASRSLTVSRQKVGARMSKRITHDGVSYTGTQRADYSDDKMGTIQHAVDRMRFWACVAQEALDSVTPQSTQMIYSPEIMQAMKAAQLASKRLLVAQLEAQLAAAKQSV